MKTNTAGQHMNLSQVECDALRWGRTLVTKVRTMKREHRTSIGLLGSMVVLILLTVATAKADTIDFSNLPGPNGNDFLVINQEFTDGTFTVDAVSGQWFQDLLHGNPAPSIYDGPVLNPGDGTIEVDKRGRANLFTFGSLDYESTLGDSTYFIQGFDGTESVFTLTGTLSRDDVGFRTLTSGPDSNKPIDKLVIAVSPSNGVSSIAIDNIVVSPFRGTTPEPGSLLLLGSGILGVGGLLRRRRRWME